MRERPIIFSAPMVRAILSGAKTQTRRAVKPQPPAGWDRNCWFSAPVWGWTAEAVPAQTWHKVRCPFGQPGDRLWVRETWQAIHVSIDPETGYGDDVQAAPSTPKDSCNGWWSVVHAATDPQASEHRDDRGFAWRPSIHMPRWASRILLEVVRVRVERLQAINEVDAIAEGADPVIGDHQPYRAGFMRLWESINGPGSWDANPWVWVIEFKKLEQA